MKSGTRALLITIALFLLWGTVVTGPFRYFAYAFKDFFRWLLGNLPLPVPAATVIVVLLLGLVTIGLLLLSAGKFGEYIAGLCALLSLLYYLFTCIQQKSFDAVSFPVTAGLALALLFVIFRGKRPSYWLGDAYIFAIPVLLFSELVLTPISTSFNLESSFLQAWVAEGDKSLLTGMGNWFEIPLWVWTIFLFALILIPIIFFSRGRHKG